MIMSRGGSANERRSDGTPALVLAARRGDVAAADALIEAGAEVDAGDRQGRTALMHAVERDWTDVARVLLTFGADPGRVSGDGTTALELAQSWQRMRAQFMFGQRRIDREPVDAPRSVLLPVAIGYELRGDAPFFDLWAQVVEHTVSDLGDDEFHTLVGAEAEAAHRLASRLLNDRTFSSEGGGSWLTLGVTADEVGIVRGCLLNLAYGPRIAMPEGLGHDEITDLFEELVSQLRQSS